MPLYLPGESPLNCGDKVTGADASLVFWGDIFFFKPMMSPKVCPNCERSLGKGTLLQCTKCSNLFHPSCSGITVSDRKNTPNWICSICKAATEFSSDPIESEHPNSSINMLTPLNAVTPASQDPLLAVSQEAPVINDSTDNHCPNEQVKRNNFACDDSSDSFCDFSKTFVIADGISHVIVNSALFFICDAFANGIPETELIETVANFYSLDALVNAKNLLWKFSGIPIKRVMRRGNAAELATAKDIMKMVTDLDQKGFKWPVLVPRSFRDCPLLKSDSNVRLDRLVSDYGRKLEKSITSLERIEQDLQSSLSKCSANLGSPSPSPLNSPDWPPLPISSDSVETITIANPPASLRDPVSRKNELDKFGSGCIKQIKKTNDLIFITVAAESGKKFSCDLKDSFPDCLINTRKPKFFGIIRGVDIEFDIEALAATLPGILEFRRLGMSRTVKVSFESEAFLKYYIVHGIKFGYELYRVEKDKVLPKRCFACQSPSHTEKNCDSSTLKCARCSGNHRSTKNTPCTNPICCANCNSTNHPSYSFSCPAMKKLFK